MNWRRRRPGKLENGFDSEVSFHLQQLTDANIASGLGPDEARRQALIAFGGAEQIKQQLRDVHSSTWRDSFSANGRSALRSISRSPAFAATILLTLAFAIGINSAVFAAVDAIVLRPLHFPHGDELMEIQQQDRSSKTPLTSVSTLRLEDWNRLNSTFQAISGYYTGDASLTSGSLPEKISIAFVAPRFLQLWGVRPALGRDFTAEEQRFGGPSAILVSDRFWRTHLEADPHAAGRTLRLSGATYTIAGVMPRSFFFPVRDVDLWEPNPVNAPYSQDRESTWFTVLGRLKPGVSAAQAQADLRSVQRALGRQYPRSDGSLAVDLLPLKSVVLGGSAPSLWLLYGSVSLLLLIACTNIAALLLARTTEREHEIAIRYSLGASRAAIVGQLLTEAGVLAVAGAAAGLLLAAGAAHIFATLAATLPRVEEVTLSWRVVAYSLLCALAATMACGLAPAVRGSRRALASSLAASGRTQVSGRHPAQWILVGVQVSLAVALLIASGLLLRSFDALGKVDPGFDPSHVLTLRVSGGWGETADMGKLLQRVDRTLDGLRRVPGVEAAATSATIPGSAYAYPSVLKVAEGAQDPNRKILADEHFVSAGYFAVLHIATLTGDVCRAGRSDTVVVNRSFADKYFGRGDILGYHLANAVSNPLMKPGQIVGVVGDAREQGVDTPVQPTVYWCYSAPTPDPVYLVGTQGDPAALAETLRRTVHGLEPGRSVYDVMPLADHLDSRQAENRLRTILLTLFALTAVFLFSLGLYGTIAYLGRTRRREVGLRLALGALPRQIAAIFLWQGLRVTLAGGVAGLLLGAAISRLLSGVLYGISPLDPPTYLAVVLLTLLIAGAASLVPAVRAATVDPTQVLREE